MRFWFDTEFHENGRTIDLISIGIVAEDDRVYYAETDFADAKCSTDWLKKNVLPHLRGGDYAKSPLKIAREVREFVGEAPEIWAYYADYDWVALCQLFGTMMDLPNGWPMFCRDVKQLADSLGNPKLPAQKTNEHYALADAVWCREAWQFLQRRKCIPRADARDRLLIGMADALEHLCKALPQYPADVIRSNLRGYQAELCDAEPSLRGPPVSNREAAYNSSERGSIVASFGAVSYAADGNEI